MIRPGAVSAVACGIVIPGILAGTGWTMRRVLAFIQTVGIAQDDDTDD